MTLDEAANQYGPQHRAARELAELRTALAQSEAGAAGLREFVQEAAGVQMTLASGRVLKKEELLSTTAGAETLAEMQDLRDRLAKAELELERLKNAIAYGQL